MICDKFEFVGCKVEVHLDEKVFQIQLPTLCQLSTVTSSEETIQVFIT